MQVDEICFTNFVNFVDLAHLAHLPWLISQPSVAPTMIIYESSLEPLASWKEINHHEYNSWTSQKFFNKNKNSWVYITRISHLFPKLLAEHPFMMGNRRQLIVVSGLSVGIPLTMGFRPQLVVVSGLSVGIPLTVRFRLSRSLWLSRSLFTKFSSFTMEFRLSRSLSWKFLFHDVILAITKPFSNFSFTWWNSGYH
jgi:hypothetical protein